MTKITQDPAIRSGQPIINGTRLAVKDVVEYIEAGMTPKEIIEDFPSLQERDVLAAVQYSDESNRIKETMFDLHNNCFTALTDLIVFLDNTQASAENDQNPMLSEDEMKQKKEYEKIWDKLRDSMFHVEPKSLDLSERADVMASKKLRELQSIRKNKGMSLQDISDLSGIPWSTVRRHFAGGKMTIQDYCTYSLILDKEMP